MVDCGQGLWIDSYSGGGGGLWWGKEACVSGETKTLNAVGPAVLLLALQSSSRSPSTPNHSAPAPHFTAEGKRDVNRSVRNGLPCWLLDGAAGRSA